MLLGCGDFGIIVCVGLSWSIAYTSYFLRTSTDLWSIWLHNRNGYLIVTCANLTSWTIILTTRITKKKVLISFFPDKLLYYNLSYYNGTILITTIIIYGICSSSILILWSGKEKFIAF